MAKAPLPSIETLRNLIDYDPDTGRMVWRERPREMFPTERSWKWWNVRYAGAEAGTATGAYGHRTLKINDISYSGHRVAWAIHHGEWPNVIDHINGDPADNRIANLRNVTMVENQRNQKKHSRNTSGICGVYWNSKTSRWFASIGYMGGTINLGEYNSKDMAKVARKAAEKVLGYSKRHGT